MVELKTTAKSIFNELVARGIKVDILDANTGLLRYSWRDTWHLTRSSTLDTSSFTGGFISDRKPLANAVAIAENIPVPPSYVIGKDANQSAQELLNTCLKVVVKPTDGAHGQGVTVNVSDSQSLARAIEKALEFSGKGNILVQQQVEGDDLRLLVIGDKMVAAAKRVPATVVGDARHTIRQLILNENATNPNRGENYQKILNKIDVAAAERYLGTRLDGEVPAKDQEVRVVGAANIGTGGQAYDITDVLRTEEPQIIDYAQRLAKATKLDCCGVDFLWDPAKNSVYFIEINACPSFGLHERPSKGQSRPVSKYFVDFLLR